MNPLPPCDHDECPATGCEATPETDAASQGIFYVRATAKLCRTLELERNRLRERVAALERAQAPGSVAVTHEQLKAVLKQCRWGVESAPGDSPPDGYETLSPEQTEIADACWLDGMDQLSTALLNWCHDQVKLAPAPVAPAADAAPVTVTDISPLTGKPIRSEFPKCPGCGNEINPDVCCCGELIKGGHHDNHYSVPLGCECLVDKGDDAEIKAPAPVPATAPALTREQIEVLKHVARDSQNSLSLSFEDRQHLIAFISVGFVQPSDRFQRLGEWRITEAGRRALREQAS